MTYDINAEWKKAPKPDNGLPEDGDYFGRIGNAEIMASKDGATEWLKLPIVVQEGQYGGEKIEINFFYQSKGEYKPHAIDKLKKLSDQADKRIRENAPDFMTSLETLSTVLAGRAVKFNQTTKDKTVWLEILEVFDGAEERNNSPALTEADLPF